MAKGADFERRICKEISLWWTKGKHDDIFWRTVLSGGRATIRKKKGKRTKGQFGDITATDPIGQPFLDLITVEVKKGYNRATIGDILDKGPHNVSQQWEKFLQQVQRDAEAAETPYWTVIHQRYRRQAVIYIPWKLYVLLSSSLYKSRPWFRILTEDQHVFATSLNEFFKHVKPKHIKKIGRKRRRLIRVK